MSTYTKIIQAVNNLATQYPVDEISYADIARLANVHWTTVRRHLGSKEEMRKMLSQLYREHSMTDTRTRVLNAAIQIFAKHGYHGTTMDQVASEAGQTKSVVYWHFSNKKELYLAICERNLIEQARQLPAIAEEIVKSAQPIDALSKWLYAQLQSCFITPDRPMLFFEFFTSSRDPELRDKLSSYFDAFYEKVTEIFRVFQAQHIIRNDVDPQSLTIYIQTVLNGLLLSSTLSPKTLQTEKFAQDAALLIWKGISSTG